MFPSSLKTQPAGLHHSFMFAHQSVRDTDPLRDANQCMSPWHWSSPFAAHGSMWRHRNSVRFSHAVWWKQRNCRVTLNVVWLRGRKARVLQQDRKEKHNRKIKICLGGCAVAGVLLCWANPPEWCLWIHWTRFTAPSAANFSWVMWIHPHQLLPTPGIWAFQPSADVRTGKRSAGSFYRAWGRESVNHSTFMLSKSWCTSPCQILYFPLRPSFSQPRADHCGSMRAACKSSILDITIHQLTATALKTL